MPKQTIAGTVTVPRDTGRNSAAYRNADADARSQGTPSAPSRRRKGTGVITNPSHFGRAGASDLSIDRGVHKQKGPAAGRPFAG